ncbi:hypothetical protein SASPL_155528 (mitochondrion) [Salvia splendens]|uniref:Uncharacterized protein n=1 Tax=Salvia splendens TaxID=180675 RepID=A0A8X8YY84_SALSN|nr:hypothetical protein SASPL_156335 [Salvia splendens]KAG6384674.1 hypothetical protein SASPL_155528 [Salvia splendens]
MDRPYAVNELILMLGLVASKFGNERSLPKALGSVPFLPAEIDVNDRVFKSYSGVIPPPIRPDERSTELHPYSPGPCTSLSPGGWPPILDLPISKKIPGSIWFSIKVTNRLLSRKVESQANGRQR